MFHADDANGRWLSIFRSFGVTFREDGRGCECPICGGKDRFRFDDKEGRGTWYCNQCGAGDGYGLLMKAKATASDAVDFKAAVKMVETLFGVSTIKHERPKEYKDDEPITQEELREQFGNGRRITDGPNLSSDYLRSRGITVMPPILDDKFCPLWHNDAMWHHEAKLKFPCLTALFQMPDGKTVMFHKHYIDSKTGGKIIVEIGKDEKGNPIHAKPKLSSRACVKSTMGGAVRLFPADKKEILIGEGIETMLSAAQHPLFRLEDGSHFPAWACLTANRLSGWIPPPGIEFVGIVVDNDKSGTGLHCAAHLSRRLRSEKIETKLYYPTDVGADWNDVLLGKSGYVELI
jgi:putative DNA primase/helicase